MKNFENVNDAREFLIKKGYHITTDGKIKNYSRPDDAKPKEKRTIKYLVEKWGYEWLI